MKDNHQQLDWPEISSILLPSLKESGYLHPNPTQVKIFNWLTSHRDCGVIAPTGVGKSVLLLIWSVNYLINNDNYKVIIVQPTKELVNQSYSILKELNVNLKVTRLSSKSSLDSITNAQLVISVPQSLNDHIKAFSDTYRIVVILDEVDALLGLDFIQDIKSFLLTYRSKISKKIGVCSHSSSSTLIELSHLIKSKAILVDQNNTLNNLTHTYKTVSDTNKFDVLVNILNVHLSKGIIVFANSISSLLQLEKQLRENTNLSFYCFYSDMMPKERKRVLNLIKDKPDVIVLTTDLLGRGISLKQIRMVVNWDFKNDLSVYTNRSGRTGRYMQPGVVVNLVSDQQLPKLLSLTKNKFNLSVFKVNDGGFSIINRKPKTLIKKQNPKFQKELTKIINTHTKVKKPNSNKKLQVKINDLKARYKTQKRVHTVNG